jgi:hypothetical protein
MQPVSKRNNGSGNLFSLLAAASNSNGKGSDTSQGNQAYQNDSDNSDDEGFEEEPEPASMNAEEVQREQIRQRFLEAIRASAANRRRDSSMGEAEELE